jgi:dolichol-phosphate mannosyltransferase
MAHASQPELSVVIPLYNEAASLPSLYKALRPVLDSLHLSNEILFVDDGSTDESSNLIKQMSQHDSTVRTIHLSRNFGKEIATTAGLHHARGRAIIMLDADGQHPVSSIPDFVERWQHGAKVVIGRPQGRKASVIKRAGSKLFYGMFKLMTGMALDPDTTDFRLIDQSVQAQFNKFTEHKRITRGLIDLLGYRREYVEYEENPRLAGTSPYSFTKLLKLAVDSAISLSVSPLYITAYIGAVVLPLSTLLGLGMVVNYVLGDPLNAHITGGGYLIVLILFLIGVLLVSQGIIGLYLTHIHTETQNRPLYIIDAETPGEGRG